MASTISATEATKQLGYANRSSLTRLVQAGRITPVFTASGTRGEQFFDPADVESLASELSRTTPSVPPVDASPASAGGTSFASKEDAA